MTTFLMDPTTLAFVLAGALIAGFTTGFAGFGTGLVASGLWFHALPAPLVPPLVALASVAAHVVGLTAVRKALDWRRAAPFLIGGIIGVPLGTAALTMATPDALRLSIGAFLVIYAVAQLTGLTRLSIAGWGGRPADGAVGIGGGFLGGFAGLSGPLPLLWLQLRGGPSDQQRATYQPFNMVILALAVLTMTAAGRIDRDVLMVAGLSLPVTLFGAWLGARVYAVVSEALFRRIILALLLVSGAILVGQSLART